MVQLATLNVALEDIANCCLDYSHNGHVQFEERASNYMPSDAARASLRVGSEALFKRHVSMIESCMRVFQRYVKAACLPPVPCAHTLPAPALEVGAAGAAAAAAPAEELEADIGQLQAELRALKEHEAQLQADMAAQHCRLHDISQATVWPDVLPGDMQDPAVLDTMLAGVLSEAGKLRSLLEDAAPLLSRTTVRSGIPTVRAQAPLPGDDECAALQDLILSSQARS